MAQTKTKPKKRSTGGKSTSGSKKTSGAAKGRSSSSRANKQKSTSSKAKSTSSKAKSSSSKGSARSKSKSRSGGKGAKRSKSSAAKQNGGGRSTLEKMKVPATVAGAAMLAAAGGLAASKNGSKGVLPGGGKKLGLPGGKSGLKSLKKIDMPKVDLGKTMSKVDLPKPEEAIDWVEDKAKGVGDAGYRVAELTSQARSLRKMVSGDD